MNCQIKSMAAKILTALLISLSAMLVSGAPSRNTECEMLHQIKDTADSLKNSTLALNVFVEDLRDPNQTDVRCKIATLCKAQKILSGHPKTVEDKAVRPVIRALNAYKDHHSKACNGTSLENLADEQRLRDFLGDMVKCVQVLYHNCPRVHTRQQ